jgi:retron-type reverse transcriptase
MICSTSSPILRCCWLRGNGCASNRGARTAVVDGATVYIRAVRGEAPFLADLRTNLKAAAFVPLPVRERMIPKSGGKLRRLAIPTVRDRVAQAALKLVLEPIFEADFRPCSYGFRPRRGAQNTVAEIVQFHTNGYRWVPDADIEACFDAIHHTALMDRVRRRVGDKRLLRLVKAFLKAGISPRQRRNRQGHRHAARRHLVSAARERGPVRPRRSLRRDVASHRNEHSAPRHPQAWWRDLSTRPLRGTTSSWWSTALASTLRRCGRKSPRS